MSNELKNIVLKVFEGGSFCNDCSQLRFRYIRSGSGGEDFPECKVLDGVSHLDECPGIDDQIEQQVSALQKDQYIPGLLRCPKCTFRLVSKSISMASGTISANDSPETCPNCETPMWRITYKEDYTEESATINFLHEKCNELDNQVSALKADITAEQMGHMGEGVLRESIADLQAENEKLKEFITSARHNTNCDWQGQTIDESLIFETEAFAEFMLIVKPIIAEVRYD